MAVALRSLAHNNNGTASATPVGVGMPPGFQAGDLLLAIATATSDQPTPPTGWTRLNGTYISTWIGAYIFYKIATGSEGSTTFTAASATVFAYSGVDNTTPFDGNAVNASGLTATWTAPALTTTINGDCIVALLTVTNPGGLTLTTTAPYTPYPIQAGAGGQGALASGDYQQGTAGAITTASGSADGTSQRWIGFSIALHAAPTLTVNPTGIPSAEAFGTPTVTQRWVITPTGIASAEAFGTPNVLSTQFIRPTGIASREAFGVPTLGVSGYPVFAWVTDSVRVLARCSSCPTALARASDTLVSGSHGGAV